MSRYKYFYLKYRCIDILIYFPIPGIFSPSFADTYVGAISLFYLLRSLTLTFLALTFAVIADSSEKIPRYKYLFLFKKYRSC